MEHRRRRAVPRRRDWRKQSVSGLLTSHSAAPTPVLTETNSPLCVAVPNSALLGSLSLCSHSSSKRGSCLKFYYLAKLIRFEELMGVGTVGLR